MILHSLISSKVEPLDSFGVIKCVDKECLVLVWNGGARVFCHMTLSKESGIIILYKLGEVFTIQHSRNQGNTRVRSSDLLVYRSNGKWRYHITPGRDLLAPYPNPRCIVISRTRSAADSKLGLRKGTKPGMPVFKMNPSPQKNQYDLNPARQATIFDRCQNIATSSAGWDLKVGIEGEEIKEGMVETFLEQVQLSPISDSRRVSLKLRLEIILKSGG